MQCRTCQNTVAMYFVSVTPRRPSNITTRNRVVHVESANGLSSSSSVLKWTSPAHWRIPSPLAKVVETSLYFLSLLLTIKKNKERIRSLLFSAEFFFCKNFLFFPLFEFCFVYWLMRWVGGWWWVV